MPGGFFLGLLNYVMTLFHSSRERRLWTWAAVVVVAIYSTLGLARRLADVLAGTGVGESLFVLCFVVILVAIVTQGLKTKPTGPEIGVALGVAAAYLMVFVRMAVPTERSHLIEYGVVALIIHEALRERASQGRRVPVPALLAVLATSLVGTLDECIQWFVPSRVFDRVDIMFNVLAAVMSVAASGSLRWVRQRPGRDADARAS